MNNDVTIEVAHDGYSVTQRINRFFRVNVTAEEIRSSLIESGDLSASATLRFFTTQRSMVAKEITDMRTAVSIWETVRVDIVPKEQATLRPDEELSIIHHLDSGNPLKFIDSPFYFVFKRSETAADLLTRIRECLKLNETEFKRISLLMSHHKEPFTAEDGVILKGDVTLQEAVDGYRRKEITNPYFFLLHPHGKAPSRRREEGVKIYT